jgi:hypothetical protein
MLSVTYKPFMLSVIMLNDDYAECRGAMPRPYAYSVFDWL